MYLLVYVLGLATLLLHAPAGVLDPVSREFVVIVAVGGIWRYGWEAVHFVRALIYLKLRFPRIRFAADRLVAMEKARDDEHPCIALPVHIIVTSYRIRAETTVAVFRAVFEEAARYEGPVTVVASIVELADMRLIKWLFHTMEDLPDDARLIFVRLAETERHDALAVSLRAISRRALSTDGAVVIIDGNTILPPETLARSVVFFRLLPEIAGLTTDEDAVVRGGMLLRKWCRLRFALRHLLMSSMGLSKRLLPVTGRMSVVRASLATRPEFIEQVREDARDHWRSGRTDPLTGGGESTWFWLFRNGYRTLYVPDVQVLAVEHPHRGIFPVAPSRLTIKWLVDMPDAGGRIQPGPWRIGLFTWWSLIDRRASIWAPLIGPIAAIGLGWGVAPVFLYLYLVWVMVTRLIQALMLLALRPTVSGLYPLLIYCNQVFGALIKCYLLFRTDIWNWTRHGSRPDVSASPSGVMRVAGSVCIHVAALIALMTTMAFLTGLLNVPPPGSLTLPF